MGGHRQAGARASPAARCWPDASRRSRRRRRSSRSSSSPRRSGARRWPPRPGCRRVRAVVAGGSRRQESVAAGFAALDAPCRTRRADRIVLVHDGARPLVEPPSWRRSPRRRRARRRDPGRCPSPRRSSGSTADRIVGARSTAPAWARAQTPQGVRRDVAARRARDASRATAPRCSRTRPPCSRPVESPSMPFPAIQRNLKVTLPGRSRRAWPPASRRDASGRARRASASDSHPFGPGRRCGSAGSTIDGAPRLHGHSDGDVVLHAVATRCSGARGAGRPRAALPGRCRHPARHRQRASCSTASSALARGRRLAGRRVDLTIIAARPRLARPLDAMRPRSPTCSRSTGRRVNVKASTRQPGRRRRGRAVASRRSRVATSRGAPDDAPALHDTLTGETRPFEPLRARPRRHLQLRADGLRAGPHRQLPLVPVRRPARPPPALARLRRDLGDEHHRRRRQDHPRRAAEANSIDDAGRSLARALPRPTPTRLRMTRPDVLPRATDHIDQIVALIATLLERGHAYRTDDGSIFFRIASWPAYGRLARLDPSSCAWRARRSRRVRQGRRPRLRALEGPQAGEPVVATRRSARAGRAGTSSARR